MTRNTKFGIIVPLSLHPDAAQDLRDLMVADPGPAGKIAAFLEQAKRDPKIIDSLLDHEFGKDRSESYNVSKWLEFWKTGFNLWRLKFWTCPKGSLKYRVVYAYQPSSRHYHILAIVHRDFNYEDDHEATQRVLAAYRSLGITTLH
ncbi:MAG: hypothetical protein V5B35_11130 [Candidatus Accumulibacter necessarius]|uniref:hypothetical protein n=1 Tax=Candidatus Accumulibacter necessarius TaxID=2954386 RepID=UPI002FC378C4